MQGFSHRNPKKTIKSGKEVKKLPEKQYDICCFDISSLQIIFEKGEIYGPIMNIKNYIK